MNGYLWAVLIVFVALYFYINRNRKQKQAYFQAVMTSLQEKGVPSDQLLQKLTPTESGKILVGCFSRKIPPYEAADMLLEKYNSMESS